MLNPPISSQTQHKWFRTPLNTFRFPEHKWGETTTELYMHICDKFIMIASHSIPLCEIEIFLWQMNKQHWPMSPRTQVNWSSRQVPKPRRLYWPILKNTMMPIPRLTRSSTVSGNGFPIFASRLRCLSFSGYLPSFLNFLWTKHWVTDHMQNRIWF